VPPPQMDVGVVCSVGRCADSVSRVLVLSWHPWQCTGRHRAGEAQCAGRAPCVTCAPERHRPGDARARGGRLAHALGAGGGWNCFDRGRRQGVLRRCGACARVRSCAACEHIAGDAAPRATSLRCTSPLRRCPTTTASTSRACSCAWWVRGCSSTRAMAARCVRCACKIGDSGFRVGSGKYPDGLVRASNHPEKQKQNNKQVGLGKYLSTGPEDKNWETRQVLGFRVL
jgi:hypothetical protein